MIYPQDWEHYILIPAILLLLMVLSLFDLLARRIPLPLNLALLTVAAFRAARFGFTWLIPRNALIGFFFFFLIRKLTKNGLGLGDAILSSSMAVLLGIRLWLGALSLACAAALLCVGVKYLITKGGNRRSRIPFAPFLSLATCFLVLGN